MSAMNFGPKPPIMLSTSYPRNAKIYWGQTGPGPDTERCVDDGSSGSAGLGQGCGGEARVGKGGSNPRRFVGTDAHASMRTKAMLPSRL